MSFDKKILPAGIALVALYIVYSQPLSTAIASVGIAVLLYAATMSKEVVLVFLIASLFLRQFNRLFFRQPFNPVGVEAFQVRDAPSINTRLESVKTGLPLAPKVAAVTGVLESPHILDNTPLQAMDSLAQEGVPGASIPASAKARVLIYPPAEGFVPAPIGSIDAMPMANPYLQEGEDPDGVRTSLFEKGTDGVDRNSVSISDMAAVGNAAPAF